ncbi:MAG: hypothetical protein ACXAEI_17245 [Candidatus Hodarchaeales archaeon]
MLEATDWKAREFIHREHGLYVAIIEKRYSEEERLLTGSANRSNYLAAIIFPRGE